MFLELVEGIPQILRIWRLCHCSAVTADISLIESPPDFLTTLEPFRVRFPVFLELVEGITQTLRVWRLCHCSAVTADISLLKSPPDFLTALEPFRVRFPVFWSWWRESNPQPADYKSAALPLSHTSKIKLALHLGLEPRTYRLTAGCSTIELMKRMINTAIQDYHTLANNASIIFTFFDKFHEFLL